MQEKIGGEKVFIKKPKEILQKSKILLSGFFLFGPNGSNTISNTMVPEPLCSYYIGTSSSRINTPFSQNLERKQIVRIS